MRKIDSMEMVESHIGLGLYEGRATMKSSQMHGPGRGGIADL